MTDSRPAGIPAKRFQHVLLAGLLAAALSSQAAATAGSLPISNAQRDTAQRVAQSGVPLTELAPGAPDSYTVKAHDTLWDISKLFLRSPWRWPELWGMNREQINNPHLIYPGQVLVLVKTDGRARLELAQAVDASASGLPDAKLSPSVRTSAVGDNSITAIPLALIEPFLTEAVVFETDELARAPRIVAAAEGRVLLTRGDLAYARGELSQASDYRVFRSPHPLIDPSTHEILGYEAPYLGTAELLRTPDASRSSSSNDEAVPSTLVIRTVRQEIGMGDRLSPVPQRSFARYIPHSPSQPISGQIVSVYGDALSAGQNQIVVLNRGSQDGVERGHVLALWTEGRSVTDNTSDSRDTIRLPDERHGVLFVFQVYARVSYALIVSVKDPVTAGDHFTQP